ncbi:MAG: 2-dehydro-3-deoxygluconokinase [Gaiellaceae bacterium]|nr:2-dehydro-3-deoxygluconokinase [Gaiellaceae bacterium]
MSLVLTAGETMALLDPVGDGEPRYGDALTLRVAGAESNFAIALARLGVEVTWVSRVGDDPFGRMLVEAVAGEGVDVRVRVDAVAPTGLFAKWRGADGPANVYYRRGSAASALGPEDVPDELLDGVALVHLTGITTALGASARELVHDLVRRAKARGALVSFDPNYRAALWGSPAEALAAHAELLPLVDWYLCGVAEGQLLFGVESAGEVLAAVLAGGAQEAVVRLGAEGALTADGVVPPARVVAVRDEIGAGDGFAAGYAWARLQGWDTQRAVAAAHCVAASVLHATGDWETYPTRDELLAALA